MPRSSTGKLTQKRENFIQAYIETGNASEAYRRVYSCERMKATSIKREAAALLSCPEVAARIGELRTVARANTGITLERHISNLERLRDKAEGMDNITAAIRAEELIGRASGLYVERREVDATVKQASIIIEIPDNGRDRTH